MPELREALLGLAAARLRFGRSGPAADALHAALSRHAFLPGVEHLATAVAAAAGVSGWCAAGSEGRVYVGPAAPDERIEVLLDGVPVRLRRGPMPARVSLPPAHSAAATLAVRIGGWDALGSPVSLVALRHLDGIVAPSGGGLEGWAWHPADPARRPVLRLVDAAGRDRPIRLSPAAPEGLADVPPFVRPWRFRLPAATLHGFAPPFSVRRPEGPPLPGTPLDPAAGAAPPRGGSGSPPPARTRRRPVAVAVRADPRADATLAGLDSLLAARPRGVRLIVTADPAGAEPPLKTALARLAARRRIVLIAVPAGAGPAEAANAAARVLPCHDLVVLDGGVRVFRGWLAALRAAAYADPRTGTASALPLAGSLLATRGPPPRSDPAALARHARAANRDVTVEAPTAAGPCVYLRRDCLKAAGPFRAGLFAQGEGAVEDVALRAAAFGWRHVIAASVAVGPVSSVAGDAVAVRLLRARNHALLVHLHPGLVGRLAAWTKADPLASARRRLDAARWRAAAAPPGTVVFVGHSNGGGVERVLQSRARTVAEGGARAIVLRPARLPGGGAALAVADALVPDSFPDLLYAMPREAGRVAALLRAARPVRIEVHHLMGHHPELSGLMAALGAPVEVHVHDYAAFCPRVALIGPSGRYCGEPALEACEACVADTSRPVALDTPVRPLVASSRRLLRAAIRVTAPSSDAARRLRRHFPFLRPAVAPPEPDPAPPPEPSQELPGDPIPGRIAVVGAIGVEKGYDLLHDCAQDAAARGLGLDFVVVGHTIDDARLMRAGRVFVTGEFEPTEAIALIRRQRAALGFLPSVWPETWCFAQSEMWRAGLRVAAFDIGAPAERIRAAPGRGLLLPLGLPPAAINNALLAAAHPDWRATRRY